MSRRTSTVRKTDTRPQHAAKLRDAERERRRQRRARKLDANRRKSS